MKNTNKVMLALAVAALSFTVAGQTKADDSLLSPRAQALKPKVIARDSQSDPDLVRSQPMGPAAKIAALRPPTVRATNSPNDPNLIRRPLYTGKTFRDTREQFEVAPVK